MHIVRETVGGSCENPDANHVGGERRRNAGGDSLLNTPWKVLPNQRDRDTATRQNRQVRPDGVRYDIMTGEVAGRSVHVNGQVEDDTGET